MIFPISRRGSWHFGMDGFGLDCDSDCAFAGILHIRPCLSHDEFWSTDGWDAGCRTRWPSTDRRSCYQWVDDLMGISLGQLSRTPTFVAELARYLESNFVFHLRTKHGERTKHSEWDGMFMIGLLSLSTFDLQLTPLPDRTT